MAYGRKFIKRGARRVKKRYYGKRKGVKVNTLARDVFKIKRMLNTEHKHLDFKFGSGQTISAQVPTKDNPIVLAIPTPVKGTAFDERIGNQLKVTHITTKIQFIFENNTDTFARSTARVRLVFSKSADDVPAIANLLEPDANGHYTNLSFVNGQEYKKYAWIKSCDTIQSHRQNQSRANGTRVDGQGLYFATYVKNKQATCNIRMMFKNNSNDVEQMKPYLVLTNDMPNAGSEYYDPVSITGQIRMTYVDN